MTEANMAHYDGVVVGRCLGCGASLREGEYTRVDFSDGEAPPWALYCKNKCESVAESRPALVGNCLVCDIELYEGDEYTNIPTVAAGSKIWPGLYCKNCRVDGKSKEEARVTLSEIPMMVAKHYAALVPFVDRDLVYSLTRDYHNHLLSIATVGNLPEEPTESDDDRWISVDERLSEFGECVLVWIKDGGATIGEWRPTPQSLNPFPLQAPEIEWYGASGERLFVKVTHWQPLPGKPKGLKE